jgi:predicted DNA-binding transcriptional regulator
MSVFERKSGRREIEDTKTGEKIYAVVEVRRDYIQEEYFCMFQQSARAIAKDRDFTYEDLRLLHLLYGYLDIKNYISVSQMDIANELNMQKQNVNRSIKILLEKGIILKGPKVGKSWTYILNANYGYKGKLKFLKQERKRHLALIEDQETDRYIEKKYKEENKNKKSDVEELIDKNHPTLF